MNDVTRWVWMEEALRESEEKYRALVENLPDVIMRFDREGRHLFANRSVENVVSLKADEFIGKTHRELGFPEEQCRFWEQSIRLVFESGEPFETEFGFESIKGPVAFNWRLVPEFDEEGCTKSVLSIARDVSEQRKMERDYRLLFDRMLDGFAVHEIILDEAGEPVDYRYLSVNPAFERQTGLEAVVGKTVLELLPEVEPYWIEIFGQVALSGEPIRFENFAQALDKHFEVVAFRLQEGQFACIFQDITERVRAEEEIRRRTAQLEALRQMGLELAAQLELDALLSSVVSRAVELLEGVAGNLHLYRLERDVLEQYTVIDYHPAPAEVTLRRGEGLAGKVWESGRPLIVDDYRHWEGRAAAYEGYPVTAVVGVPIRWGTPQAETGEEFLGVLTVRAEAPRTFSQADAELLEMFATQAAIAIKNARLYQAEHNQRQLAETLSIANAQLYEQARREIAERRQAEEQLRGHREQLRTLNARLSEAEDAERKRLARELHDRVGQNLSALSVSLNLVKATLQSAPAGALELEELTSAVSSRLDDALSLVAQVTKSVQEVMTDLRSPVLDEYGLVAALRWYGAQLMVRTGLVITVQGEEPSPRLATPVENALFRIAQEALTNVVKHAQARQVAVSVEPDGETVCLTIADDGNGFDVAQLASTRPVVPGERQRWGIISMRERAEAAGGHCRVESRLGWGTRVIVEVGR